MKQEAAQSIIEQAGQHKQLSATLDAAKTKHYKHSGGYRVRLVHRRTQCILVIDSLEQWESVLQAWQGL